MADSPLTNNSEEGAPVSSVQLSPTKPWGCPPNLCNDHVDDDHHRVVQWGCPPGMAQLQQITPISDAQLQPLSKRRSNTSIAHQSVWVLPKVPRKCRSANPPFPAYKQTVNGLDFLAFFTKIFGFSNHYPAQFHIEGDHFCCSEQYYMFHKAKLFGYEITAAEIMETSDTSTIKRLGTADTLRARQKMGMEPSARTFDHDEWREVKEGVMFNALRAKFGQNRMLQQMLLDTGDALLVEASPSDQYWGIGCAIDSSDIENTGKWRGDNRLGILLMRLRQKLHWN